MEIMELDHVAEVNENVINADSSINMNLWALNEKMGCDARVKERVDVEGRKLLLLQKTQSLRSRSLAIDRPLGWP
jgi:hypothetical protein